MRPFSFLRASIAAATQTCAQTLSIQPPTRRLLKLNNNTHQQGRGADFQNTERNQNTFWNEKTL